MGGASRVASSSPEPVTPQSRPADGDYSAVTTTSSM